MQVEFKGCRIEKAEQYNGKVYTIVGVPSQDSFSHPSKYRLQSGSQLGQHGQLIDVTCNMQGIVKGKTYFDKSSGQQRNFDETTVLFDVVGVSLHQQQTPPVQTTGKAALPEGVQVKN